MESRSAGRDPERLAELPPLGADQTCTFDQLSVGADVDVVIDYVWGQPTATAIVDILTHRADRERQLSWIQIGTVGGLESPIPSAALRAARLQIVGSGIGSVPGRDYVKEGPKMLAAVTKGAFDVRLAPYRFATSRRSGALPRALETELCFCRVASKRTVTTQVNSALPFHHC
jgi:hypothetical protein